MQLDDNEAGYYVPQQRSELQYVDMNGQYKTVPAPPGLGRFGWMCCTCFMDPCSTERRQEYLSSLKSFSVIAMIVQIIYFIICLGVGGFASPKINPMLGPPAATLVKMGAMYPPYIKQGHVWRFVTPILMHAGIIHLFSNMFCQWRFGLFAERRWGTWRYATIYMAAGICGDIASALRGGNRVGTGASGALMGIAGAMIVDILLNWKNMQPTARLPLLVNTGCWLLIGLFIGLAPGVDFTAHAIGAVAGALASLGLNAHLIEHDRLKLLARIASAAAIGLFVLVGIICFFTVLTF